MIRPASPATGCHLIRLEVCVGPAVETYDASTFQQPLEFSLQGQRSLGSDCGILSLVIASGSKSMLSVRLNDLLNHPNGTRGIIILDKKACKLCVRLPDVGHTLKVWFRQPRDFLVSVCILRKAGFAIEETSLLEEEQETVQTSEVASPVLQTRVEVPKLSSLTPLSVLAAQAEAFVRGSPPLAQPVDSSNASNRNVFDEVLDRLANRARLPKGIVLDGTGASSAPATLMKFPLLNPYNAFSAAGNNILSRPDISSPLRNVVTRDNADAHEQVELRRQHPAPLIRRHRYFTRSFSASVRRRTQDTKEELLTQDFNEMSGSSCENDGTQMDTADISLRGSFDSISSRSTDFRHLMPRRRRLPFRGAAERRIKKPDIEPRHSKKCASKVLLAYDGQGTILTSDHPHYQGDLTAVLPQPSILDELCDLSSATFNRYEKDIVGAKDQDECAAMYLNILHRERLEFWLGRLTQAHAVQPDVFVVV